jgi:ABC-type sulfate transport system permease subunit
MRGVTLGWKLFLCLLPFQFMFGLIYAWGSIAPMIHAQSGWSNAVLDLAFSVTPLVLFPSVLLGG